MSDTKRPDGELNHEAIETVRKAAFALRPAEQYRLAAFVAENVGYVLEREPDHPESPHATPTNESPAPQAGPLRIDGQLTPAGMTQLADRLRTTKSPGDFMAAIEEAANTLDMLGTAETINSEAARPENEEAWIERELSGYGCAVRSLADAPIPGEPFISMSDAKIVIRRALAFPAPQPPVEGLREALREALAGLKYIEPAIPVLRTMFMTADLSLGARKAEEMDASNKEAIKKLEAVLAALASPSLTAGPWQPIETAPLDKPIMTVRAVWWEPENGNHRWVFTNIRETVFDPTRNRFDVGTEAQPTHWFPKPEYPSIKSLERVLAPATLIEQSGQKRRER